MQWFSTDCTLWAAYVAHNMLPGLQWPGGRVAAALTLTLAAPGGQLPTPDPMGPAGQPRSPPHSCPRPQPCGVGQLLILDACRVAAPDPAMRRRLAVLHPDPRVQVAGQLFHTPARRDRPASGLGPLPRSSPGPHGAAWHPRPPPRRAGQQLWTLELEGPARSPGSPTLQGSPAATTPDSHRTRRASSPDPTALGGGAAWLDPATPGSRTAGNPVDSTIWGRVAAPELSEPGGSPRPQRSQDGAAALDPGARRAGQLPRILKLTGQASCPSPHGAHWQHQTPDPMGPPAALTLDSRHVGQASSPNLDPIPATLGRRIARLDPSALVVEQLRHPRAGQLRAPDPRHTGQSWAAAVC